MKIHLLLIFSLFAVASYSQSTINNFKYVLVPERFEFSKEDNQYGLNTTAQRLLEQKGFTVFVGDRGVPPALAANKCNALKAEVVQRKAFFTTNLTLILKDCQGNVIFKGKEGKSREKEFQLAYDEALRDAFVSLNSTPYKYDSTALVQTQQIPGAVAASVPATTAAPATAAAAPASVAQAPAPAASTATDVTGALYAQIIPNGYQVIDTTPKKVMTLLKTSLQDYYIAEAGGSNGVVFKKDGEWYFEYYKDNKLVSQKLEIKF